MTPEQQRIAIAKACGWKYKGSPGFADMRYKSWIAPDGSEHLECPNYLSDLNAMHEAEKVLVTTKQQWDYQCNLFLITCGRKEGKFTHKECFAVRSATAAQRAEAFLKTLGLFQ